MTYHDIQQQQKNTLPSFIFSITLPALMKQRRKVTASAQNAVTETTASKVANILTVRLDDDLALRLEDASKLVHLDKSQLARICLEAVVKMIEKDQQIIVPLNLVAAPRTKTLEL